MAWGVVSRSLVAVGLWGLLGAGCATTVNNHPPSSERLGTALSRVTEAENEPMRADTQAHQLRRQARSEYQAAIQAVNAGDNQRAQMLIARAEADAELSLALARRAVWTAQAAEADVRLRAVREAVQYVPPATAPADAEQKGEIR